MKTVHRVFVGENQLNNVVMTLANKPCWFTVEPCSESNQWRVMVRPKNRGFLNKIWRTYNSLIEGMVCPKCGHNKNFVIQANTATVIVNADYVAIHNGSVDWDYACECVCPACDHHDLVVDFIRKYDE